MKFILYTLVVLYILYKLNKFLVKYYLSKFVNQQQQKYYNQTSSKRQEGEINVEYLSKDKRNTNGNNKGDYVDYEVVK